MEIILTIINVNEKRDLIMISFFEILLKINALRLNF